LSLKQKLIVGCLCCAVCLLGLGWPELATRVAASRGGKLQPVPATAAEAPRTAPRSSANLNLREFTAHFPLSFEQNVGQLDSQAKFSARGAGYNLFLTSTGALLEFRKDKSFRKKRGESAGRLQSRISSSLLGLKLQGANPQANAIGVDQLSGHRNYFLGNDPAKWRTDVPTFRAVRYEEIYPGISLTYYGNQQQLEYDFAIASGADPQVIRLTFDSGVRPRISAEGDLVLRSSGGEVRQRKPVVYQEMEG